MTDKELTHKEIASKGGKTIAAIRGKEGMAELQLKGQEAIKRKIEIEFGGDAKAFWDMVVKKRKETSTPETMQRLQRNRQATIQRRIDVEFGGDERAYKRMISQKILATKRRKGIIK